MRRVVMLLVTAAWSLAMPSTAAAQSSAGAIHGFGGLTVGTTALDSAFGGGLAINLTPNLQLVGEAGRIRNLLPSTLDPALAIVPFDLRMSALYGEGGVRLLTSSRSPVRGYVEGTAGVARLDLGIRGAGSIVDGLVNSALGLVGSTEPVVGLGGGVILQGGPMFVDLGYRHKRVLTSDLVPRLIGAGGDLTINQLRVGVGLRF